MATKKERELAKHKKDLAEAHSKLYFTENKLLTKIVKTTKGNYITKEQLAGYFKGRFANINPTSVKILEETLKLTKGR